MQHPKNLSRKTKKKAGEKMETKPALSAERNNGYSKQVRTRRIRKINRASFRLLLCPGNFKHDAYAGLKTKTSRIFVRFMRQSRKQDNTGSSLNE